MRGDAVELRQAGLEFVMRLEGEASAVELQFEGQGVCFGKFPVQIGIGFQKIVEMGGEFAGVAKGSVLTGKYFLH